MRLWALSAEAVDPAGYLLRWGPSDEAVWSPAGVVLRALGFPVTFVAPRARGPGCRVVGIRRLARLRELVGDPPVGVSHREWPS